LEVEAERTVPMKEDGEQTFQAFENHR